MESLFISGGEHKGDLRSPYDKDSACGELLVSSNTSSRSAIAKYDFEHGRRYDAGEAGRKQAR